MLLLAPPDPARFVYPIVAPKPCPRIVVDTKEAPDLAPWAREAVRTAKDWWPHVTSLLATGKFRSPKVMRFVFREKQDPPAYCAGDEISFKASWIRDHPNDIGIVVHEMTHAIQAYPRNEVDSGWLVEGIADYIRWWRYEPEAPRSQIDFSKASYRDAYRTTAAFLAWSCKRYDSRLVPALDRSLREGKNPLPIFVSVTGKSADDLWSDFRKASGG